MKTSLKMPKGFSIKKAHRLQSKLAKKIVRKDVLPAKIRMVAGVDAAYAQGFSVGGLLYWILNL